MSFFYDKRIIYLAGDGKGKKGTSRKYLAVDIITSMVDVADIFLLTWCHVSNPDWTDGQ